VRCSVVAETSVSKIRVGDVVTAKVVELTNYGAWIEWDLDESGEGRSALVLLPDMPKGTRHPSEWLRVGQGVIARITRHDGLHTRAVVDERR